MRILLVGGSGGLGQASGELLAAEGCELIVSYNENAARAEAMSSFAKVVQADITGAAARKRLLDEAGALDGLVVFTGDPARVKSPDQLEQQMLTSHAVNFMGPLLLAREAADRMKQHQKAGSMVLFSTMQGVGLFPNSTAYAGAKAALIHGARILAKELRAPHNIRVNVIAPGIIDAGMAQASIATGKYDRFLSEGVITRFGRASDVARVVRFLLEPDSYITGQVISVDGGVTL
jgi:NAD(P)-dependent dehydrogenase (short-subunit alcohol dehydrogenase family)